MPMANEDLFKEHYFYELGRRESLNSSLSFPVGLITLIASVLFVLWQKVAPPLELAEVVLLIILGLCSACLAVATFFLIKAYWGYTYKYMPLASALHKFRDDLTNYYKTQGMTDDDAESRACEDFSKNLDNRYAEDTRINSLNNDTKSTQIFKANSFIVSAIALGICAAPAYFFLSYNTPEEPYRVEISNLKDIVMPTDTKPTPTPATPPAKPPAPTQQQKPQMPPSRDVREHVDPPKVR
jgi:hypothetical protein